MRKLSNWGAKQVISARFIIVTCHILLLAIAVFLGVFTYTINLELPAIITIALTNLFFIFYFLYPTRQKKSGFFRHSYLRQKSTDFLLALTYPLAIAAAINTFAFSPEPVLPPNPVRTVLIVERITPESSLKNNKKTLKAELKKTIQESKQKIKTELKALKAEYKAKKDKAGTTIVKILLILLTIFLAIGLAYLVAALACSISCSGQGALAVAVLLLGLGGIIWLTVIAIKAIVRKVNNRNSRVNEPTIG